MRNYYSSVKRGNFTLRQALTMKQKFSSVLVFSRPSSPFGEQKQKISSLKIRYKVQRLSVCFRISADILNFNLLLRSPLPSSNDSVQDFTFN